MCWNCIQFNVGRTAAIHIVGMIFNHRNFSAYSCRLTRFTENFHIPLNKITQLHTAKISNPSTAFLFIYKNNHQANEEGLNDIMQVILIGFLLQNSKTSHFCGTKASIQMKEPYQPIIGVCCAICIADIAIKRFDPNFSDALFSSENLWNFSRVQLNVCYSQNMTI